MRPNLLGYRLKIHLEQANSTVIPAKAGIQRISNQYGHWIPAFAGMTHILDI